MAIWVTRRTLAGAAFGLVLAASGVAWAAPDDAEFGDQLHYDVMEFSAPASGKEAEFDSWYAKKHIPALKKVAGVKNVQRYHVEQTQRPGVVYPSYYVTFSLTAKDLDASKAKLSALMDGGDVVDKSNNVMVVYAPMAKVMASDTPGTTPAMAVPGKTELKTFYLLAFVNVADGKEADFNKGYNEIHLPDVVRVPGMVWGQRSKAVAVLPQGATFNGNAFPGYLAAYEFKSYDVAATNDEVNRRLAEHITRGIPGAGRGGMTYYTAAMTGK